MCRFTSRDVGVAFSELDRHRQAVKQSEQKFFQRHDARRCRTALNSLVDARVYAHSHASARACVRTRSRTLVWAYACVYAYARHRAMLDCGPVLPQYVG